MRGGIYTIRFDGTERFYVGKAINFTKRWHCHLSLLRSGKHHNPYLQAIFNKHGEASARLQVEERIKLADERTMREQSWLDAHKSGGLLLNMEFVSTLVHTGKRGVRGEPWNKGLSSPTKGIPRSAEVRQAISAATKGKKRTPEQRARISEAKRGQPAHNRGAPASEAARLRMSEAAKGRTHSPETRARMSAAHQARIAKARAAA
jgi:group I intron endonuclease